MVGNILVGEDNKKVEGKLLSGGARILKELFEKRNFLNSENSFKIEQLSESFLRSCSYWKIMVGKIRLG